MDGRRVFPVRPLAIQSMTDPSPATSPSTSPRRPVDDEISLWEVLGVLLRRRGTIIRTTILVTLVASAVAQFRPLQFTTATSFRPQASEGGSTSQMMALASQFGVNVPGSGGDETSPAFYEEILTSREILARAATEPYLVEGLGPMMLKDLLEIEEDTEAIRDAETIEWLREEALSVSTGRETGTVTVSVTTEWPDLSKAIATELLDEVARFNQETRHSTAESERTFIEGRMREAEGTLEVGEDSLRAFLESNRQWQNSPLLQFQHGALMREVTLRSTVLTTLIQAYEQARISEVRDTPVITVLQAPFLPPKHDPRRRVLSAALGIVLGGMLGIVGAFLVEAFRRPSVGDPAREDFQETWKGLKRSIPFMGGA
jgi:uncharacterized protein involved in exopolysaccharide biosynthesis